MADALISFAAGLLVTYYGWRPVPAGPNHLYWVEWNRKWGRLTRITGPLLLVAALVRGLLG